MTNDPLKENTMRKHNFKDEDEYWESIDTYCDNLLADEDVLLEIRKYIETHNINDLGIKAEMMIARDMFGGYRYGTKNR